MKTDEKCFTSDASPAAIKPHMNSCCEATWPLSGSEASSGFVLIETSEPFICIRSPSTSLSLNGRTIST